MKYTYTHKANKSMLLHSFTEMNIAACTHKFPIVYTTRYTLFVVASRVPLVILTGKTVSCIFFLSAFLYFFSPA